MGLNQTSSTTYDKKLIQMFEELDALEFPLGQYVIVGSGPLGIRNIREIRDLDIVVSNELWKKLSEKHKIVDGDPGTKKMYIDRGLGRPKLHPGRSNADGRGNDKNRRIHKRISVYDD